MKKILFTDGQYAELIELLQARNFNDIHKLHSLVFLIEEALKIQESEA